jgi:phosphate-selective porin
MSDMPSSSVYKILASRSSTHGDYSELASIAQRIKHELRKGSSWQSMASAQQEALELIATKLARIAVGNPHDLDHWDDISGYAQLAAGSIRRTQNGS